MPAFSHTSPQQPQMSFQVRAEALPARLYFVVSAVFHYLGPAFAVLLFARVDLLGVAWIRIASAALVFAAWKDRGDSSADSAVRI
jgi:inner membrane transporter RhtA